MAEEILADGQINMLKKYQIQLEYIFSQLKDTTRFEDYILNIDKFISSWNTARIDLKNMGNSNNSIKILNNQDKHEIISPNWFKDNKGEGLSVQSTNNIIEFDVKCVNAGEFMCRFMGSDFRIENEKVPVYVSYTDILINNNHYYNDNIFVWHNNVDKIIQKCENNEIIHLKIEYKTIYDYFPELKSMTQKLVNQDTLDETYEDVIKYIDLQLRNILSKDSRIKIGVLGSCVSRSIFMTNFNSTYKSYFQLPISYERISLISLMQEPLYAGKEIEIHPLNSRNKFRIDVMKKDLSKSFLSDLDKYSIDYLIMDMYFEVIFGVYMLNDTCFTGNYWDYPYTDFFKNSKNIKTFRMKDDIEKYFSVWKKYCDKFFEYMHEKHPDIKIILNKVACTDILQMEKGFRTINKEYTIFKEENNGLFKLLEDYIEDNFDVIVLNENNRYITDNHIFGLNSVHYHKDINQKLYIKLLSLIMQDKMKTR